MSAALVVMYQRAESADMTRTQLTRVGGLLQELNAAKADAMKGTTADAARTARIRSIAAGLVRATDDLKGTELERGPLLGHIAAYQRAIELETGLLEQGRFDAARKVDDAQLDPLIPVLRAEILVGAATTSRDQARSNRFVQLGLVVWVLLLLAITSIVVWRLSRARARATAADHETSVLQESEARFRSLVQNSTDAIVVVDRDGVIRYEGASVANVLGYVPGVVTGQSVRALVHPDDVNALSTRILAVRGSDAGGGVECRWLTADERWLPCETMITNLVDDPHVRGWVLNTRDISDRKALERELTFRATHDALTGLANRARFGRRVGESIRHAVAPGSIAILYIDIDNFKQVNDSEGHSVGDAVLVEVADRLRLCVREGDEVARLGGDEFAILLDSVTGEDEAIAVAVRILEVLAEPILSGSTRLLVSASVGVAVGLKPVEGNADLVRKADQAMYVAKQRGKSGYELYRPEIHARLTERLAVLHDLSGAIERDEIVTHYQPIVEVATGRVARVEALARWRHPSRGILGPADFIPLAEESGLIVDIGRQILRQACRQVARYRAEIPGRGALGLNVNVAPKQLEDPSFAADVQAVLAESGLPPQALTLELTENTLLREPERVIPVLETLRSIGVGLAVDDFGTGFSSLSYLQRLPVDHLKIDRSFARSLCEPTRHGLPLLGAIVGLANAVGLQATAEGIETAEQLERLQSLDCRFVQGFFISPPVSHDDCQALLEDWPSREVNGSPRAGAHRTAITAGTSEGAYRVA